jgi:sugar/nucleoside kinase (ribokinase family)
MIAASTPVLLGPASIDRYVDEGVVLPGGGAVNMAWHLATANEPVHLLTRVGDDAEGELVIEFLDRHRIGHSPTIVAAGRSSSIDIEIGEDRQPWMDHFVPGVWSTFEVVGAERELVAAAATLHVVLVDAVVAEVDRLGQDGLLGAADGLVSGDFLSFRRWDIDRFAHVMAHLDLGVIGWPGDPDDPLLDAVREVAFASATLVVVTLGSRGVRVFDGRPGGGEAFVPVEAVDVVGTTVGCGDAFVAAFLREWWHHGEVMPAVEAGKLAGAAATAWIRPLPDTAY